MAIWYSGICDVLLTRVQFWYKNYEFGEVCKDQDYLSLEGEVQKKPTMYAYKMPWSKIELSHLVRIMQESNPNSDLTKEVAKLPEIWKRGQRVPVPGEYRMMTLAFYKEHVKEILDTLLQTKSNTTSSPIDEVIKQRKEAGKDLFEV